MGNFFTFAPILETIKTEVRKKSQPLFFADDSFYIPQLIIDKDAHSLFLN